MELTATKNMAICCSVFYHLWGLIFFFFIKQYFHTSVEPQAQQMAVFYWCRLVKVQITLEQDNDVLPPPPPPKRVRIKWLFT